ncbi:hypothetical protein DPMN_008952 [Dreissena polymorpha]|uniref:Uncharacterized protein n=1 Tax=Dreissena polymorpha TaxID=45954 RepID=A0A9D4MZP8_DREPO|nr:hypothetical protein DPMN_008952 [Dreissena polymorpha]
MGLKCVPGLSRAHTGNQGKRRLSPDPIRLSPGPHGSFTDHPECYAATCTTARWTIV